MPVPEWLEEMPGEASYDLTMFGPGGESVQEVSLARDEYVALKVHLAATRGIQVSTSRDDEKRKDRQHLLDFVREKLSDINIDRALMALDAIQRNTGRNTPAESFFSQLASYLPEGLTPEDVTDCLEEFQQNFADLEADCSYVHRFYPDLAAKAAEAGKAAR